MKTRLDVLLHERGLFESRAAAKAAVMAGLVSVDGHSAVKPGTQVRGTEDIRVARDGERFVSRGGTKLRAALEAFAVDVRGKRVLDVGASTGGFTDCLLQAGAARVAAVDVGKGQLHWKLRTDERVTVLEGLNARELTPQALPFEPELAVVDVSFISLEKILEPVFAALTRGGAVVALVKPQFEAGRKQVGKGGVVRDPQVHVAVLAGLSDWLGEHGMEMDAVCASPITGPKGNIEFFALVKRGSGLGVEPALLEQIVMEAHRHLAARAGVDTGGVPDDGG